MKVDVPNKEPGAVRYLMAANATGGGSLMAFLISALVFFPLGYYTKYKNYKEENLRIVGQSITNKNINQKALSKLENDSISLNRSLTYLGYDKNEIDYLFNGEVSKLESVKNKFTKWVKGDTIYLPREDCEDDYLGLESSNEANDIIVNGKINRYKEDD